MIKSLNYFLHCLLGFFLLFSSCEKHQKSYVSETGQLVTLENEYIAFVFDRSDGTYSITDKSSGYKPLSNAALKINDWSSRDNGFNTVWQKRPVSDSFGDGLALDLVMEKENCPKLLFTFILYNNHGFINASGGIVNTTGESIQLKEIYVVSDARLYEGVDVSKDFAMVEFTASILKIDRKTLSSKSSPSPIAHRQSS